MHGIFNKMASMKAVRPKVESAKKKGGLSLSLFKPKTGQCFSFLQRKALESRTYPSLPVLTRAYAHLAQQRGIALMLRGSFLVRYAAPGVLTGFLGSRLVIRWGQEEQRRHHQATQLGPKDEAVYGRCAVYPTTHCCLSTPCVVGREPADRPCITG